MTVTKYLKLEFLIKLPYIKVDILFLEYVLFSYFITKSLIPIEFYITRLSETYLDISTGSV